MKTGPFGMTLNQPTSILCYRSPGTKASVRNWPCRQSQKSCRTLQRRKIFETHTLPALKPLQRLLILEILFLLNSRQHRQSKNGSLIFGSGIKEYGNSVFGMRIIPVCCRQCPHNRCTAILDGQTSMANDLQRPWIRA